MRVAVFGVRVVAHKGGAFVKGRHVRDGVQVFVKAEAVVFRLSHASLVRHLVDLASVDEGDVAGLPVGASVRVRLVLVADGLPSLRDGELGARDDGAAGDGASCAAHLPWALVAIGPRLADGGEELLDDVVGEAFVLMHGLFVGRGKCTERAHLRVCGDGTNERF